MEDDGDEVTATGVTTDDDDVVTGTPLPHLSVDFATAAGAGGDEIAVVGVVVVVTSDDAVGCGGVTFLSEGAVVDVAVDVVEGGLDNEAVVGGLLTEADSVLVDPAASGPLVPSCTVSAGAPVPEYGAPSLGFSVKDVLTLSSISSTLRFLFRVPLVSRWFSSSAIIFVQ